MDGKRFLHSIRLQNLLSFGEEGVEIELQPLNVLIGPNGSGKSNLIEAISILAATPKDIAEPFRGEGVSEWLWKGTKKTPTANIFAKFFGTGPVFANKSFAYDLSFEAVASRFSLVREAVQEISLNQSSDEEIKWLYEYKDGQILTFDQVELSMVEGGARALINADKSRRGKSILSKSFAGLIYELSEIGDALSNIRIYRNPDTGRDGVLRKPQSADDIGRFLAEDGSNLSSVINDLQRDYETKQNILRYFQEFYEPARDIALDIIGNTLRIIIHEEGLSKPTPISRLSDGSVRYLCLLTILCHPNPPPLVCIEEPELGLHPDIIPTVAKLLIDASQRTQLIVTTHSDILISALSDVPEAIIVCEKNKYGTSLERLDPKEMKIWMEEEYSLGNLWRRGQIGGNRW
jgi:predicted ATPase